MLFASLIIEREPLQWRNLGAAVISWIQDVGGVAELACLVVLAILLSQLFGGSRLLDLKRSRGLRILTALAALAQAFYAGFLLLLVSQGWQVTIGLQGSQQPFSFDAFSAQDWLLTLGGSCATLAFVLPCLMGLGRLRVRRIGALARLSFKEAMHRRVVWVFALMAILFLFAGWFIPYKPEDQVRNYVQVVYFGMSVLLWLTGSLLAAFSIPTDVRNQTIHTIVTKPVERFEIVIGRVLGYGVLLTLVLAVLTGLSLLYVVRGVTEDAKKESYKARVPIFGEQLSFYGTKDNRGESVGREWGYRSYLPGPNPQAPSQLKPYAFWSFQVLPRYLASRTEPVPFEFTFDIFRLTKGTLDRGVFCTLTFASGGLTVLQVEKQIELMRQEFEKRAKDLGGKDRQEALAKLQDELIAKYGVFENRAVEAQDYHTQSQPVPASLFKKVIEDGDREHAREQELRSRERAQLESARQAMPAAEYQKQAERLAELQTQRAASKPTLKVLVTINPQSHNQLLGLARRDLYLLAAELPFWQNFIKGSLGLWFSLMLLLGLAVACSTYLSGVISWFVAMFLFIAGFFLDDIRRIAEGAGTGGGPLVSTFQIINRMNINAQLPDTPTVSVARGTDAVFRWWLRQFLKVIPDVSRFDLTEYVGSGFDIPWTGVLLLDNLLPLIAYLLPWAVLAYYLMEQREIANPS